MSIFLIRHGETALNATRVIQWPDTPLSDRGQNQAKRLGERLSTAPLAAILSSDYQRAHATASALHAATGAPLELAESLRERHLGELRGRPYAELDLDPLAPDYAPPGGESWDQFHARAARAWDEVAQRAMVIEGDLAVVTHGLVLRSWCAHVLDLASHISLEGAAFANTCVTRVDGPPWRVELLACDIHLTPDLRASGGKA